MNKIFVCILTIIISLTFGCQKTECSYTSNGGFCTNKVNADPRFDDIQHQIDELKSRVIALENQNALIITQIDQNESEIVTNTSTILSLQSQINLINSILPTLADQNAIFALQASLITTNNNITALENRVTALESQIGSPITGLQAIITNNTVQITQLMNNHNVTKIVDPCGNGPGYDEVFFRTTTGKLIASFSDNASGLNTRFSELVPGTFSTTDGTGCIFTVNPDMSITSSPTTVEY